MKKLLFILLLIPSWALADCQCVCMNGQVQALCTSTLDIKPICSSRICPLQAPSIKPIQTPSIPPIGTNSCSQQQVYNEYTKRYEWKNVCY